jgi:uncharacterized membrane protein YhhN
MSHSSSKSLVAIVAILAVFSIPILGILTPILADLIPLVYIVTLVGMLTLAGRNLLELNHKFRLEELEARKEMLLLENKHFQEAERLIALDEAEVRQRRQLEATEEPSEEPAS